MKTGRIYKIITQESNDIYIGSTFNELRYRFVEHKSDYNRFKANKYHYISSFDIFDKYGIDKCKMILIKEYEVVDREHLKAYEQLWINKLNPINKYAVFSIKWLDKEKNKIRNKEYYQKIKEKDKIRNKEKARQYYEKNKEKVKEYQKQYRDNNKDKIKEKDKVRKKEYREKNKEKIKEKEKQYREKNKEQKKEYLKRYNDKNKEYKKAFHELSKIEI